jgi:hypothetical protein
MNTIGTGGNPVFSNIQYVKRQFPQSDQYPSCRCPQVQG